MTKDRKALGFPVTDYYGADVRRAIHGADVGRAFVLLSNTSAFVSTPSVKSARTTLTRAIRLSTSLIQT